MRRRKAWRPDVDERRALTEHLFHEVQMTFFLASQIGGTAGARLDASLRNAQIEAFTAHLRQLVEFFWAERPRAAEDRRAFAADYFAAGEWERIRPELPRILYPAIDEHGIEPLRYDGAWRSPAERLWEVPSQAFALVPVLEAFVDSVNRTQLLPGYANGMRICSQMLTGAGAASAAA